MDEVWKEISWIDNLRGTYEVSNFGNIRRTSLIQYIRKTGEYKIVHKVRNMLPFDNGHGYLYVALILDTENGRKRKNFYIHRLVAEAFIPKQEDKTEINHKNFVRTDNRTTNLEWCTFEENMAYSSTMDRRLKPHYPNPK